MLEIILLLGFSVTMHFLALVFNDNYKPNARTLYKASVRIIFSVIGVLFLLVILKPIFRNETDAIIIIAVIGYFVFNLLFFQEQLSKNKKNK